MILKKSYICRISKCQIVRCIKRDHSVSCHSKKVGNNRKNPTQIAQKVAMYEYIYNMTISPRSVSRIKCIYPSNVQHPLNLFNIFFIDVNPSTYLLPPEGPPDIAKLRFIFVMNPYINGNTRCLSVAQITNF